MESHIIGDIITVVILVIISAYLSATDSAFTLLNRTRMKNLSDEGNKRARLALRLEADPDRLFTAVLIGRILATTAAAAVAVLLFLDLCGKYGIEIAIAAVTVALLVFAEIAPRSMVKEAPEQFAMASAPVIRVFTVILTPVTFLLLKWRQLLSKLFHFSEEKADAEDQLLNMVEEAQTVGEIDNEQGELIQNAIEFNDLLASDVLTPRVDMKAIDIEYTEEEVGQLFKETGLSRLPVYEDDMDKILGVLNQKDFHNYIVNSRKTVGDFIKPVVFVSAAIKISVLLKKMQQLQTHLAIVVDEYGGTEGLVTMEDIIEELVGEIYDEHDAVISQEIIPLQNGSFRIKCSANIAKVFDYFGIEEELSVQTVNGWVVTRLDKLPEQNDAFTYEADGKLLKVRVTKADDRRALEINLMVEQIESGEEERGTKK